jgi:hypothetical protein
VLLGNKPEVKPTALHMTSGQQGFLRKAVELARTLKPGEGDGPRERIRERFRERLFGPWRYRDKQHPLGWDPVFERLHALQARSPTKEDPLSVSAVVWLAFESLPLFPVATRGGRLLTGGFDERSRYFSWPIWEALASLDTVRSLLSLTVLSEEAPPATELRARGIRHVFRSQRAPLGDKGLAIFKAADLVL